MKNKEDNEIDICVAISEGDREALSHLFKKYYSPLYNYGLKIIHDNKEIIKDSIQEIFLQSWINRRKLAEVKSIRPYLFSALRLTIYDQVRRQKGRIRREATFHREYDSDLFNIEEIMIHFEIKKENEDLLRNLLGKLSNRKKEAIYLKFFHGFSNEEIATIMDINIQSVYNLISNAIASLRDLVDQQSQ